MFEFLKLKINSKKKNKNLKKLLLKLLVVKKSFLVYKKLKINFVIWLSKLSKIVFVKKKTIINNKFLTKKWLKIITEFLFLAKSKLYIYINLKKYHYFSVFYLFEPVAEKLSVLDFCNILDITIPHYCYHPDLSIAGNCRMCLIELNTSIKPIACCAINVMPNMILNTSNNLIKKIQQGVLEFLLLNHPLDCPVCDQGGECDLQDISYGYGNIRGRLVNIKDIKRAVVDTNCNFFVKFVLTRCIHCTRCIRFLSEHSGNFELGMLGRGRNSEIGLYSDMLLLNSELSSNIIELCPVGALTSKLYSYKYRSWENFDYESYDFNDSLGLSLKIYFKHNTVSRVLPSFDYDLTNSFLTEKARYVFDAFLVQRFEFPLKKTFKYFSKIFNYLNNFFISISWKTLKNFFFYNYFTKKKKLLKVYQIKPILGDLVDIDLINYLKTLLTLNGNNYYLNNTDNNIFNVTLNENEDFGFRSNYLLNLTNLSKMKFCFLLNINLRLENPILNSKLRQEYLWNQMIIYSFCTNSYNLNYNYKFVSNNLLNFLKMLEGRNWLNLILTKYNSSNKIFLLGSNFFNKLENINKNFLKLFFEKFQKNNSYYYICQNISKIGYLDYGYFFGKFTNFVKKTNNSKKTFDFSIFLGSHLNLLKKNFLSSKKNKFIIYQSAFFLENAKMIDLFIPTLTLYESKKKNYINCIGLIRKILFFENFSFSKFKLLTELEIIFILFTILPNFYITYLFLNIFNFFNFLLSKFIYNFNFLVKYYVLIKTKLKIFNIKNVLFVNYYKNIYKINIINIFSQNLTTLSTIFFKNYCNFNL